ncbi:MAG: hypothetical protein NTX50_28595 [Candidatus Sumerlaeota bacterium]|nr:hypothetical protein [Candidatus Sumerlaeota bacterium]
MDQIGMRMQGMALALTLAGMMVVAGAEEKQKIAGWEAVNNCQLSVKDGNLIAKCTGEDPQINCTEIPAAKGAIVVTIMAKAAVEGGQIYWASSDVPEMSEDTRVDLGLETDQKIREYKVTVPVKGELKSLRIDPGDGEGTVEIASIQFAKEDGTVIKKWTFGDKKADKKDGDKKDGDKKDGDKKKEK